MLLATDGTLASACSDPRLANYSQRHRAASAIWFRLTIGVEEQGGHLWALLPLERDKAQQGTRGLANTGPVSLGGREVPAAATLPLGRPPPPSSSHDGGHVLPPLLPLPLFGVSRHTFQRCCKNSRWTRHSGTLGHAFPESTAGAGSVALLSL